MDSSSSIEHRRTWDLIPWLVNDSIGVDERRLLEDHLRECADCRDEFAFQCRLQAGMAVESATEHSPQPALQRLLARIDAEGSRVSNDRPVAGAKHFRATRMRRSGMHGGMRWLAVALATQAAGLILVGTLLYRQDRSPDEGMRYQTLSRASDDPTAAAIRFVPSPTLTVGALQAILGRAQVHIVRSNAGGTIYGLALDDTADTTLDVVGAQSQRVDAALTRLRSQDGVLLAEPIAPAPVGAP